MSHAPSAFAAVVLGLALAVPAQGQQTAATLEANVGPPDARGAAEALRNEAISLHGSLSDMGRIVALRLEAARVAPLEDALRAEDLYVAGALSAGLGRLGDAQKYLEEAAAAALAFGDLPHAAQAYLQAAVAAAQQGAVNHAQTLVAQADLLSHSPLMPLEACDCIHEWVAMLSPDVAGRIKP
jgi:tetratricopeptide (TPR) repeat protein